MTPISRLRIVVGYPSDAHEGRIVLERCLKQEFFKTYCSEHKLEVELVAWDTHAGPGIHEFGPQGWIDLALNIKESDLFVAIFQGKLGTPYKEHASGTVYEIDSAIRSFKERQSPQVWVCTPSASAASLYKISSELGAYVATLSVQNGNDYQPLYRQYDSSEDLFQKFSSWLFQFLIRQGHRQIFQNGLPRQATVRYDIHADVIDMPAECLTAPAAPLIIALQGSDSHQLGTWRSGRVDVYVNTNLTSPQLGSLSLTVLKVQQPDGAFGKWSDMQSVHGIQFGANAIRFDVAFQFTSAHRLVRLAIENLFVNAGQLGVSTNGETFVLAHVDFSAHNEAELQMVPGNVEGKIGRVVSCGFAFRLASPAEQTIADLKIMTIKAKDWAVLRFEGTLTSRLPRKFIEALCDDTLPRSSSYCGLRLLIRMHTYGGKYVCVPTRLSSASGHSRWSFVQADANGAGRYPVDEIEQIIVNNESYYVIPSPDFTNAFAPNGITAAYEPQFLRDSLPEYGELKIQLLQLLDLFPFIPSMSFSVAFCLAPCSTVTTASRDAPIPRFFDYSTLTTITLSATLPNQTR